MVGQWSVKSICPGDQTEVFSSTVSHSKVVLLVLLFTGSSCLRYCQPPAKLWEWMEPYLEDEEVGHFKLKLKH